MAQKSKNFTSSGTHWGLTLPAMQVKTWRGKLGGRLAALLGW